MKRYLILSIGDNHVAMPYSTGAEVSAAMSLLAEAKPVTSTGYGDEQKWTPTSDDRLQMQLIDGARVTVGDEVATLKAKLEEQTRTAEQNSKYWMSSNAKVAALEKQLKELMSKPIEVPTQFPAPVADDSPF